MRDLARRLPIALGVSLALGLITTAGDRSAAPQVPRSVQSAGHATGSRASAAQLKTTTTTGPKSAGLPGSARLAKSAVDVASSTLLRGPRTVAPLRKLLPADVLVVAPTALPGRIVTLLRRLPGVVAAEPVDAARIEVNGTFVAMLGVDPATFRAFAAPPTARSSDLWQNVADGGLAVSYSMGKQDKIPLGGTVLVAGARPEELRVGGFGTVGIAGVDAVVSTAVARTLGLPAGNAIVVSAPHAVLSTLDTQIKKLLPRQAAVAPLVAQVVSGGTVVASGAAGAATVSGGGPGLSGAQVAQFLAAAESRIGMPYVWGAAGPRAFDCSGLVQWSLARAGVVMPRVAVDQARTGPSVPVADLQPGDLLFYHTDPTAPTYISHVAIYLGDGMMLQAPEPGMDVEVVPAIVSGSGFAGAVRVYPRVAAAVAADPAD